MEFGPKTVGEKLVCQAIDNLFPPPKTIAEILKVADTTAINKRIAERLDDLNILADPEYGRIAIKMIQNSTREALDVLSLSMTREDAEATWYSKSWDERGEFLAGMDDPALDQAARFCHAVANNARAKTFLNDALAKIVKPAEKVAGYHDLIELLQNLARSKLVLVGKEQDGIKILKDGEVWYRPNPKIPISPACWHALKEAEKRAQQASLDAEERRKEAEKKTATLAAKSQGFKLLAALDDGKNGDYCLRLPNGNGVLLRLTQQPNTLRVETLEATWPMKWNPLVVTRDGDFRPIRGGNWPTYYGRSYDELLREELDRERRMETRKKTALAKGVELQTRLSCLMSTATLSDKAVTKILKGEAGVAVACCPQFRLGEKEGLVAIALERREDGLWLKETVSDHPFLDFESLKKEALPAILLGETGKLDYADYFSGLPASTYRALITVKTVLQMAINAERQAD